MTPETQPQTNWEDVKAAHYKAINDIAESWEERFGKEADKLFQNQLDQCLAFITEEKQGMFRERKSFDWDQLTVNIATYLDNVGQDEWRTAFVPLLEGVMQDTSGQLAASFGAAFNVQNIGSLQWFDEYTFTFAQDINTTTKTSLADLCQQGKFEGWTTKQLQDNMLLMFEQWRKGSTDPDEWDWYDQRMPAYRREMIARTETMRATNYGGYKILSETGTGRKEWLATSDARTRPSHMSAWADYSGDKAIPMNQPFNVNGSHLMYPGDPKGDPSETINCRCTLIPYIDSAFQNTVP